MLYNVRIEGKYFTVAARSEEKAYEEAKKQYSPSFDCHTVTPCEDVNGGWQCCPHLMTTCDACVRHYYKGEYPDGDWVD